MNAQHVPPTSTDYSAIPLELRDRCQWVVWRIEQRAGQDKPTKVPYNARTGGNAKSNTPATWSKFHVALRAYLDGGYDGVGYVVSEDDPYTFVDFDHCRDAETGRIDPSAFAEALSFASYAEISQSGTGLHVFGKATIAEQYRDVDSNGKRKGGRKVGDFEAYSMLRFATMTGAHLDGTPATIEESQEALDAFCQAHFPPREKRSSAGDTRSGSSADDDEILKRLRNQTNTRRRERFLALFYAGDFRDYHSQSEADQALCNDLAHACGPNSEKQIDRLFRRSKLMRDKWNRADYRDRTIRNALGDDREDFTEGATQETAEEANDTSHGAGDGDRDTGSSTVPPSDGRLPHIITSNQQLRDPGAQAIEALDKANTPPVIFRRAGTLARLSADEAGRPIIALHDRDTLKARLTHVANFFRISAKGEPVGIPPSDDVTRYVLAQTSWPFPALRGVVECPIIRPGGSLLLTPGYDAATRLIYHAAPGFTPLRIPDKPSAADRARALAFLQNELLVDFPFDGDASMAHALALFLTPILRAAIPGKVPLALITAPTRGTGKGLLAQMAGLTALGHEVATITAPDNEAEWNKKITSTLISGAPVVLIDNITGVLKSPALEALLTLSEWTDRILGVSENRTLPNRTVWAATGNNLQLAGDLPRRCYRIRLDAERIRPERRSGFLHDPLDAWVLAHRGEILAALLTLARSWYADDCPAYDVTPMGSYEEWARVVGSVLAHAGVQGFLSNLDEMYDESDSEGAQWGAFFGAWHNTYNKPVTSNMVAHDASQEDHPLHAVLPDELQPARDTVNVNVRKLGQLLRNKVDVRYAYGEGSDEITLQHAADDRTQVARWHVRLIQRAGPHE